jgi:NADH dehydrogenase
MKIAITGSTGFIGSELVSYFMAQGHEVIKLQRRSITAPDERFFDVRSPHSIPDLRGIDALIHTAFLKYDSRKNPDSSDINISMALALEQACRDAGCAFVFLSTMSAHVDAISHYGKHKYEIEQRLDRSYSLILRLGLVIGRQGLFDTIRTAIAKSSFIPLVGSGSQPIQTIAMTDICRIIETALNKKMKGLYSVGSEKVYTLRELYIAIAERLHKKPTFIAIPYMAVDIALSAIAVLRIPFNVSKENLLGLKQLRAFDTSEDIKKIGVPVMDMTQALDKLMKANT